MAEWSNRDQMSAALMNQKTVYVGSGAPGTAYDGQFWVDTSTDPPTLKMYDSTNTQWLTMYPIWYETQSGAWADPSESPVVNGTIVVVYNSTQADTRLYVRANSAWKNLDTTPAPTLQEDTKGIIDVYITHTGDWPSQGIRVIGKTIVAGGDLTMATDTRSYDNALVGAGYAGWHEGTASSIKIQLVMGGTMVAETAYLTGSMVKYEVQYCQSLNGSQTVLVRAHNYSGSTASFGWRALSDDPSNDDGWLHIIAIKA
jgi:hypothetical protein